MDNSLYHAIKNLPKLDLHKHLEGSIRPETYFAMAERAGISLPEMDVHLLKKHIQFHEADERSLTAFLQKMLPIRRIIQNEMSLERVIYEAIEDSAIENVKYVEIRFSASHMILQGLSKKQIYEGIYQGLNQAKKKYNIHVGFIVGITRELDFEMAGMVTDLAVEGKENGIVALDLFGNEEIPPGRFVRYFDKARQAGLHITVHAGETAGPENIQTAIEFLGAERIGHGVHIIEDSDVIELVKNNNIMLEMCPTSNFQTGAVSTLDAHPLKILFDMGVPVTISTDDPQFSDTTITNEYCIACEKLNFSLRELKQMIINTVDHIFCDRYISELKREIQSSLGEL